MITEISTFHTKKHTSDYTEDQCRERAELFNAFSEPARIHILNILKKYGGTISVIEIVSTFGLAQPTISHHLRILYVSGLVNYKKRGLESYYYVVPSAYQKAIRYIQELTPKGVEVNG